MGRHTAESCPAATLPSSARPTHSRWFGRRLFELAWWGGLAGLWTLATAADRFWLAVDQRLPSWDQADYLNSAVDHGRALGLLHPGGWQGWMTLLDLSPKIPPLASLVNGTVIAIAGDAPDQASWALAVWQALLLVVVAAWGRQLMGRRFGLLCATLLLLVPALAHLRVDFTLDLPLAATAALALLLMGRWQAPAPVGGRWGQLLAAALAMAAALLVKQSALLVLVGPTLWCVLAGLRSPRRRLQVVVAGAIVLGLLLPWLHHNWITTLGGTNRAVLESAAAEGDPAVLSWDSFFWYLRRLPAQMGLMLLPALPVAAALVGVGWRRMRRQAGLRIPRDWAWLIGCVASGWIFITLSPNKDARYITPVLPLLVILVARAWWAVGNWLRSRWGSPLAWGALLAGLTGAGTQAASIAESQLQRTDPAPVSPLTRRLRELVGEAPTTLLVVPGDPELNEQTVTTFARLNGGRIEGRRLGRARHEHPLVLERSEWVLLATGDQGTNRPFSRELSHRVRADGRFQRVGAWPWSEGRQVELWQRRAGAPAQAFDKAFIQLARRMEEGPAGLKPLFARIGPEHQLDAHFLYQARVAHWARQRLQSHPQDPDALWSLALISTLRNRPSEAAHWYGLLQRSDPTNPWPVAYQAIVWLVGWHPGRAHALLATAPEPLKTQPVLSALENLSGALSGDLTQFGQLRWSVPKAIEDVEQQLKDQDAHKELPNEKPPRSGKLGGKDGVRDSAEPRNQEK